MPALASLEADRARWLRFVAARVPSPADAEDVLQRALLRATVGQGSLEDESRVEAWFFRILRRAIADHRRARARDDARTGTSDVELVAATPAPPKTCACGTHFLDELRPDYADVIRRVDVDETPIGDVARALGITPGNAHVRLHRARRALRAKVERTCGVKTLREALDCNCGCACCS